MMVSALKTGKHNTPRSSRSVLTLVDIKNIIEIVKNEAIKAVKSEKSEVSDIVSSLEVKFQNMREKINETMEGQRWPSYVGL